MKTHHFILLFVILVCPLKAQDAKEIIRASHNAVKVSSFEALSTLSITDSRGNQRIRQNTMASKTFPDKSEKRIVKFVSPAEVKGTGILIYDYPEKDDDMWIYLPALKKTRRIVSSEKSKSFMGSEFSNADMSAPAINDFSYILLGKENLNGENCWRISATPINTDMEDKYGYGKSIIWIGEADNIVRRSDYYNFDGDLTKTIKTITFKQLEQGKSTYMITEMLATNHENGRSSRMKMDKIQISDTNENYFTVAYLER
jgi:hypothetical protein